MRLSSVELLSDHPISAICTTPDIDYTLDLSGVPATSSDTCVMVATRAPEGSVTFVVWRHIAVTRGVVVFDGELVFPTAELHIKHFDNQVIFAPRPFGPGAHRITVCVDDPGNASIVDVLVDGGALEQRFRARGSERLPRLLTHAGHVMNVAEEVGLILSNSDRPLDRLVAVLETVRSSDAIGDTGLQAMWPVFVGEWLRSVNPGMSLARSEALGALAQQKTVALQPELHATRELAASLLAEAAA